MLPTLKGRMEPEINSIWLDLADGAWELVRLAGTHRHVSCGQNQAGASSTANRVG